MMRAEQPSGGTTARVVLALSREREQMVFSHWVGSLGHEVVVTQNAAQFRTEAERPGTDYGIVDAAFDDGRGFELAKQAFRGDAALPVLLVVDSNEAPGPEAILDSGLDEFLVRPLIVRELMARVKQRLHRVSLTSSGTFVCGPFQIDRRTERVWVDGHRLELSPISHRILRLLIRRSPQIVPNEAIGADALDWLGSPGQVRKRIRDLRESLKPLGLDRRIVTVRRCGYRLEVTMAPRPAAHRPAPPRTDALTADAPPPSSRRPELLTNCVDVAPPSER